MEHAGESHTQLVRFMLALHSKVHCVLIALAQLCSGNVCHKCLAQ
jgi:hypothetical protein